MKKIIIFGIIYSIWISLWIILATIDAEYGVSGFFYLTMTGLPLSIVGGNILPTGGMLSLIVVGIMGLIQWIALSLIYKKFETKV